MAEDTDDQLLGLFNVGRRKVPGIVTLEGKNSLFEIYSDQHLFVPDEMMPAIFGVTKAGEKITICDSIGPGSSGTRHYHGTTRYFVSLAPSYVAIGARHLDTRKRVVSEIVFTTTRARSLFYDHGAFGSAHLKNRNVKRLMPGWARKNPRKVNYSVVMYYVDRGPMVSVDLIDRKIQVYNGISYPFPSPRGLRLKNEVRISIKFKKPKLLSDAIATAYEFKAFCEIVSQNKHSIRNIFVRHKTSSEKEGHIRIYPSYEEPEGFEKTDYRDNLVSGGFHRKEFEKILLQWARDNHDQRKAARHRVIQALAQENNYTIDRLIGATNAFDLLPEKLTGKPRLPAVVLQELTGLGMSAKKIPEPYRSQVLSNLNRVKGHNLRSKITARFASLPRGLKEKFSEIDFVIDHCVRTRNYFVHGTKPKLSIDAIHELIFFLTDTLEFIFVASELSEYGWKYDRWIKESNMGRMKNFLRAYDDCLEELKDKSA